MVNIRNVLTTHIICMQIWLMNANGNSSNGKLNGIGNVPNWSVLIWKIELKIKPNLFYVLKQNLISALRYRRHRRVCVNSIKSKLGIVKLLMPIPSNWFHRYSPWSSSSSSLLTLILMCINKIPQSLRTISDSSACVCVWLNETQVKIK